MMLQRLSRFVLSLIRPKSYVGLLGSVLAVSVAYDVIGDLRVANVVTTVIGVFALIAACRVISQNKKLLMANLIIAGVGVIMFALALFLPVHPFDTWYFREASILCAMLFVVITVVMILKDIFSSPVNGNKICGAICVFLLIAVTFEMCHTMVFFFDPNAYHLATKFDADPQSIQLDTRGVFMYFSFCTLTTLGYGDITPVSRIARTLCWMEAVIGQFYLAILVARLVGLYLAAEMVKSRPSRVDEEL